MSDSTRIKADIIPYTAEFSAVVRAWIDSEETYFFVCRGKDFPPPDDIVDSWQRREIVSHLLFSENKPVAYGELWHRPLERAIEIAHLIVDPHRRGRGFGTKMVELLYQRAATRSGVTKILANLYNDSTVALGCYLKAGFELIGTADYTMGLRLIRLVRK